MSDEPRGRGVSVTIKYGKGYEETWVNFTGLLDEVQEDITKFFGFAEIEAVKAMDGNELVINATQLAHGVGNVAATLGAVALPSGAGGSVRSGEAPDEAQNDPWALAEAQAAQKGQTDTAEPVNPNAALYRAIEAATDVDAVKRIWAENQKAFTDDADLMAAWKAKGKALKTAS